MARSRRVYVCRVCGAQFPSWTGRCSSCQEWASIGEVAEVVAAPRSGGTSPVACPSTRPLVEIDPDHALPFPVGLDEVDRVLGGGLTPGSATLLAGEPGIGKSTLTMQIAASMASVGATVVVVTGEEAPTQVAARAARLGPVPPSLLVVDDVSTDAVVSAVVEHKPQLLVVDSIQTMRLGSVESSPGSVNQVKASAAQLIDAAKANDVSLLMIGHVTKEGTVAGPRVLEHMVDTVLTFDGDRHSELRFLRVVKHRFGPTSELGIFDMTGTGLTAVPDPSLRYLQDRQDSMAGSVVVPFLSGRRPLLAEVQALVQPVQGRAGHNSVQGFDARRVAMVNAVMATHGGYRLSSADIFVSVAGGATVAEPAGDLGLALALASAVDGQAVP
ncbi:MAG: DNA repair protein RadA, partial [Acidimicrobiia bacterium]|nr:DNA repair protein RadA [Acidimicrobiia bacterium]